MIYLDYSATTLPNEEVLDTFVKATKKYVGNPNSIHKLGTEANTIINQATNQIASLLNVKSSEIIYTSGSTEANNTIIKGIAFKYPSRGKKIITTKFEHASIYGPISFLDKFGYEVEFVNTDEFGVVDQNHLKSLLDNNTLLVSICSVNSEIGIKQPINKLAEIVKENSKAFFHSDMTQSIGKEKVDLNNIDLITASAHKFYGLKGIGILIKKENIMLEPLIHGGHSTTLFRSGTPALPLIVSFSKALRLALENLEEKISKVKELNNYLIEELTKNKKIFINSNQKSIPHILNFSVPNIKPETLLHALEEKEIYISTKTACSSKDGISTAVYALTNDKERALSSLRVSISHITTKEELKTFIETLNEKIERLILK